MRSRVRDAAAVAVAHPRHLVLGALVAGLLAGPHARGVVVAGAIAALAVGLGRRDLPLGVAIAVALVAGGLVAQWRLHAIDRGVLADAAGRTISVHATLLERPRLHAFGTWSADARIRAGTGNGERVVLRGRGRPPDAEIG